MKTKAKTKQGFTIEVSCPGCGGELELDDNFFAVTCQFCGSGHRVILPDGPPAFLAEAKVSVQKARFEIDRYLKENGLPLTHSEYQLKQMYYPYWKVDAILFRARKGVEKKIIMASYGDKKEISYETQKSDISLSPYTTTLQAGLNFESLPNTLGLRSEYMKLYPLSDEKVEEDFDILPVYKAWEDIRGSLYQHIGAISSFDSDLFGVNKTEIFCPKAMLLYFPFFIFDFYEDDNFNRFVIDGVTGRVLNHSTSVKYSSDTSTPSDNISFGDILVVPHRCSNCGVDLPTEESLVYICSNCQVLTDLAPGVTIDSIQEVIHQKDSNNILVPFWVFKLKGIDNSTLKSIFGGIYHSDRVVIPAFKVQNYNALFKLTKRMSAAFPKFEIETITKQDSTYHSVDFPFSEAVAIIDLFIKTDQYKKNISCNDKAIQFDYEDIKLVYTPFKLESYFYVDSVLQAVTFENKLIFN